MSSEAKTQTFQPSGTIHIEYSEWADAPNDFMDGLVGDLYIWHRNYSFGHDTSDIDTSECVNWADHEKVFRRHVKSTLPPRARIGNVSIEPVYMYSHSGDTISRSPFSCRWDSGQVGFFVVNPYKYEGEVGWDVRCKKGRDRLMESAETTFDMWRAYVEGNVFSVIMGEEMTVCYGSKQLRACLAYTVAMSIRWPEPFEELFSLDEINKIIPLLEDPTPANISQVRSLVQSFGFELPTFEGELAEHYSLY